MSKTRSALGPRDKPVNATLQSAEGAQGSSGNSQGARLKAMLQRWTADAGAPFDPMKERVKDTVLSVIRAHEGLQTTNRESDHLLAHVSWVTEQVLSKIQANSVSDEATRDVMDSLAKMIFDINAFLQTPPSKVAEYLGMKRAEKVAQFRQDLDTLRTRFLEVRVVYFSEKDAGIYANHIPSNLPLVEIPPAPTVFYGRDELVQSIITLLLPEATCRIPLLGAGGMGKTSVAAAVLNNAQIKDKFGDNIVFLSCENITSAEGIMTALATYFQLRHDSKTLSALVAHLSSLTTILLVLDNLETAIEAADTHRVESFLGTVAQVPRLSLMITMRGTTPPDGVDWAEAYCHPLDRLLLDASRQIWRCIAPNEDTKLDELLTRLDGLPLAIRLMALQAQLNQMTPAQLLGRYEAEATKLLKTRGGGRLKNLEVSIQVSVECKTMTEERNALPLLSVLCLLPDGVPHDALPEMVPSIWNISSCASVLLQVALIFKEKGRLRVLSPIRDFVLAKYPPQGTHLEETENYFMTLMRTSATDVDAGKQVELISADFGNINSILIHFWKTVDEWRDVEGRLQMTLLLAEIWHRSRYGDCAPVLMWAKASLKVLGNQLGTAQCTRILGSVLYLQHRYDEAAEKLKEAKAVFEAIGDPLGVAQCTRSLGEVLQLQNRYEEATEKLTEANTAFAAIGDPLGMAQCAKGLGDVMYIQSRYEEATEKFREAKAAFKAIGDPHGTTRCTHSLGKVLYNQSRYGDAVEQLREAKAAYRTMGDSLGVASCTQSLGNILLLQDRYEEASENLKEAKAVFAGIRSALGMAQCTRTLGDIMYFQSRYEEATATFTEAKAAFEAIGSALGMAQCTQGLGDVLYSQSRYEEAEEKLREAQATFEAIGSPLGTAHCTQRLGDVMCAQDRHEEATEKLREAKAAFKAIGDPLGTAKCTHSLGNVLCNQSRYGDAVEQLREAKTAYKTMGDRLGVASCTQILGDVLFHQDRYADAVESLLEAKEAYVAMGNPFGQAGCANRIGAALHRQGHYDEARVMLNLAMEIFETIADRRGAAECNRCLAELLYGEGHYEAAVVRLTNAQAVFEAIGDRLGTAECVRSLGMVLCAEKHYEEASQKLQDAKAIFVDRGSRNGAAQCCRSLAEVFSAQDRPLEAEAMLIAARDVYEEIKLPEKGEECTDALARLRLTRDKGGEVRVGA
ncbi:TPR-like protein [Calocera viscosa TUFC12733]|uniref:TPR-like protein n=1 Tax=Calocera viscosa (strain TUFC12733) TaxID=1330018 RepID=A0A167HP29_CALVF|nr:TPR-like protein [Calocera viscosa TUFC12733]